MKISAEIFGIPDSDVENIRKAINDGFERYVHVDQPPGSKTLIRVHESQCPVTGRNAMVIEASGLRALTLGGASEFMEYVYSFHSMRDDEAVKENAALRIHDTAPEPGSDEFSDDEPQESDMACWLCGRMDGEEYYDFDGEQVQTVSVSLCRAAKIPLCSVCLDLIRNHDDWQEGDGD
jgi:hypothetical protein